MRYLRKFNTLDEYNTALPGLETPQTSLIAEDYSVKFTPWHDSRLDEYFTIESLEDNNEVYFRYYSSGNYMGIEVSKDKNTWNVYSPTSGNGRLISTLNYGEKLYIKRHDRNYTPEDSGWDSGALWNTSNNQYSYSYFYCSKYHNVRGNIMSLLTSNDAFKTAKKLSLDYNCTFNKLFYQDTKLISAKDLMLPAVTGTENCYRDMFNGCSNLEYAPVIYLNDITNWKIYQMFMGCTKLNYLKCLSTIGTDSTTNYYNILYNTAATGKFVKAAGTTWNQSSNGIPSGWTIEEVEIDE